MIADPDTYKIHNRVETSNGCYRATIYKNGVEMYSGNPSVGKDFFPDTWDEQQVIDAIKIAYENATQVENTNNFIGTGGGVSIVIYKDLTNGRIISAFPNY